MRITTRTRTFVLLAIMLLLAGCSEPYIPEHARPNSQEFVSHETYIGSATNYTHVYRVVDKQMGNVCYVSITQSTEGVGISCLPLEDTDAQ